ncbi:hypothetical protein COB87_002065 [Candidatus Wolfebacteria bacterium]|nr:hypothetical protein [Candidatus Wolfebacteria bacterium]
MNLDRLLDGFVRELVNPFIILLIGVATIIFIYGVLEFLGTFGKGDEARIKGRSHMVWGLIGLAIMFGVFGILGIVLRTFGIDAPLDVL